VMVAGFFVGGYYGSEEREEQIFWERRRLLGDSGENCGEGDIILVVDGRHEMVTIVRFQIPGIFIPVHFKTKGTVFPLNVPKGDF
jgi:hypothetical protein